MKEIKEIRTITLDMYHRYMKDEIASAKDGDYSSLETLQEIWKATRKLDDMTGVLAFLQFGLMAEDSHVYQRVYEWVTMKDARKLMPMGSLITMQTFGGPYGKRYVNFFAVGEREVQDVTKEYIKVPGIKNVTWIIAQLLGLKMTEKKGGHFDMFVLEISSYGNKGQEEIEKVADILYGDKHALYHDYL